MALVIETGLIVTGANSFTTDAELLAYALDRGITLPSLEADRDILQIKAVDYLTSKEDRFKGCRVSELQTLLYPRHSVYANGFLVASNVIPQNLKNAQMESAI